MPLTGDLRPIRKRVSPAGGVNIDYRIKILAFNGKCRRVFLCPGCANI